MHRWIVGRRDSGKARLTHRPFQGIPRWANDIYAEGQNNCGNNRLAATNNRCKSHRKTPPKRGKSRSIGLEYQYNKTEQAFWIRRNHMTGHDNQM
jgi:hypothetical protein